MQRDWVKTLGPKLISTNQQKKWTDFTSLIAKTTCPGLLDITFAFCYIQTIPLPLPPPPPQKSDFHLYSQAQCSIFFKEKWKALSYNYPKETTCNNWNSFSNNYGLYREKLSLVVPTSYEDYPGQASFTCMRNKKQGRSVGWPT